MPCLLLVLDWWPLGRVRVGTPWRRLVAEKWPLFAMALASCVVAFVAQRSAGTVSDLDVVPLGARVATALIAWAAYLRATAWPWNLAPHYPFPAAGWPATWVAAAGLLLTAVSAVAVWQRRRRPYLLAGWLWYLGTLVPVIGLVQVGNQAYADRYTYFPSIGLFLAAVWTGADAFAVVPARRRLAATFAGVLVAAYGALAWRQSGFWRNDLTLWLHALEVTGPDALAYNNVGTGLEKRDQRFIRAAGYYQLAADTDPCYALGQCNLARALRAAGQPEAAAEHFRLALGSNPRLATAHNDLGLLLEERGAGTEAEKKFLAALAVDPDCVAAHRNLAWLLDRTGRGDEALAHSAEAVRLDPADGEAQGELGVRLYKRNALARAAEHLGRAAEIQPESALARGNLGIVLQRLGRVPEALDCFRRAAELDPNEVHGRLRLATALAAAGDAAGAEGQFREARRLDAHWPKLLIREAWKLSTAPDPAVRDGEAAVWSAETACAAVRPSPAPYLDVLAAAYAEAGRFVEAVAAAEKAVALAGADERGVLASEMAGRLALYRQGLPFRRPGSSGAP
jgi:tetratricopeptide (TPR) repeat protein